MEGTQNQQGVLDDSGLLIERPNATFIQKLAVMLFVIPVAIAVSISYSLVIALIVKIIAPIYIDKYQLIWTDPDQAFERQILFSFIMVSFTIVSFGFVAGLVVSFTAFAFKDWRLMLETCIKALVLGAVVTFIASLVGLAIGFTTSISAAVNYLQVGSVFGFAIGLFVARIYIRRSVPKPLTEDLPPQTDDRYYEFGSPNN